MYPVTVTAFPAPTLALAKLPLPVPLTLTLSLPNGVTVGVPVKAALVAASYVLLLALIPLTAKLATVISPVRLLLNVKV